MAAGKKPSPFGQHVLGAVGNDEQKVQYRTCKHVSVAQQWGVEQTAPVDCFRISGSQSRVLFHAVACLQ